MKVFCFPIILTTLTIAVGGTSFADEDQSAPKAKRNLRGLRVLRAPVGEARASDLANGGMRPGGMRPGGMRPGGMGTSNHNPFNTNLANTEFALTPDEAHLAVQAADLSNDAYNTEDFIRLRYNAGNSFRVVKLIDATNNGVLNAFSFVAVNRNYARGIADIYVVFRGTTFEIHDLAADLQDTLTPAFDVLSKMNGSVPNPDEIQVHSGFLQYYKAVQYDVKKAIKEAINGDVLEGSFSRLIVTGHSLGGAMATLCAADLLAEAEYRSKLHLYNFGSPMVGNDKFIDYYKSLWNGTTSYTRSKRFVNAHDDIPKHPGAVVGYMHVPKEYQLSQSSSIVDLAKSHAISTYYNLLQDAEPPTLSDKTAEFHLREEGLNSRMICSGLGSTFTDSYVFGASVKFTAQHMAAVVNVELSNLVVTPALNSFKVSHKVKIATEEPKRKDSWMQTMDEKHEASYSLPAHEEQEFFIEVDVDVDGNCNDYHSLGPEKKEIDAISGSIKVTYKMGHDGTFTEEVALKY